MPQKLYGNTVYQDPIEKANYYTSLLKKEDTKVIKELSKYLNRTKKFPGLVCQEKMIGFTKKYEVKTFWINGEYKYNIAIKAWPPPEYFATINKKTLKVCQN